MIFNLDGLVVTVRKPEIADLACLAQWLASGAYLENIGGVSSRDAEYYQRQAERILQDNANDHAGNKYFLAADRFTGKPVALAMLCKIDWKNRHAEYAYIIGDSSHRAKLAAGDLNVVMYNYFFNELNLNKVYGYVFASNTVSLRMNAFGGSHDGTLRRHKVKEQGASDVHVFSILAHEFAAFVNAHAATLLKKHIERGLVKWSAC